MSDLDAPSCSSGLADQETDEASLMSCSMSKRVVSNSRYCVKVELYRQTEKVNRLAVKARIGPFNDLVR